MRPDGTVTLSKRRAKPDWCPLVRESLGGSRLVLGVDRLDYSMGIPQRVKAPSNSFSRPVLSGTGK